PRPRPPRFPYTTLFRSDAALAARSGIASPDVLDAGTGSGAIALAIKSERPDAAVVAVDASEAALAIARANAERLGLDVEWLASDWFAAVGQRTFDVIVSNPPYVESGDPHLDALAHEPRAALDGGPDGLGAIRALLAGAPAPCRVGGAVRWARVRERRLASAAQCASPSPRRPARVAQCSSCPGDSPRRTASIASSS